MNEKYFFVPKFMDHIFNIVFAEAEDDNFEPSLTLLEFKINSYSYGIYIYDSFYIVTGKNERGQLDDNSNIWNHDNLKVLDNLLRNNFPNDKIIVAIHWGGEGYQNQTKQYVDLNNKLRGGEIFLTYYSQLHDKIETLEDLVNLVPTIKERIESKTDLKKTLINLWLPLAIDIQGLKDLADQEKITNANIKSITKDHKLNEYYEEIKKEVKNDIYQKEIIEKWDELKKDFPEDFLRNDLPAKIVGVLSSNTKLNDFYSEFISVDSEEKFLPKWLELRVDTLSNKIKLS